MKTCRKGLHQFEGRQCRECYAVYRDRTRERDKLRDAPAKALWRLKNAEKIRAHKAKKHLENKAHNNARTAAWYCANQASERMKRGGVKFGIPAEEYAERVRRPCGICGYIEKSKKMHVDHDHESGRLRGTLCHDCNTGLGLFDDSTPRLLAAVEYLARYGTV